MGLKQMKRNFGPTFKGNLLKRLFGFRWFQDLKIGAKLTLGFVIVAIIAGVVGLVGAINIYRISRAGHEVYQMDTSVLGPLHRISAQLFIMRINTAYHVMESKDKFRYEYAIKTAQQTIDQELTKLQKGDHKMGEQLTNLAGTFKTYWREEATLIKLSNQNKTNEALEQINQKLSPLAAMADSVIDMLFSMSDIDAKTKTKTNYEAANQTILFMLALAIIGVIAALGLGLMISRLISKPLRRLTAAAEQLASGDLNVAITLVNAKDETAILTDSFVKMANSIQGLVRRINDDSHALTIASQELKSASTDTGKSATEVAKTMEELARAASEQSGQTNEAVSSINAVAELVRQVTKEVGNIASQSEHVAQFAKLGQKATKDVADEIVKIYNMTKDVKKTIEELDHSSIEISSITGVIQNIAEQTTLLALNAAIEAARAGEHGRGFGVVAAETGKLAEQTKKAAQLISELIGKMGQRSKHMVQSMDNGIKVVESGKNLAANATVTFEDIFNQLDYILKRIDWVAGSAQKMAGRNEDMIGIIANIAALSEESMASTEEVSAAAEEQSASVEEVNALAENLAEISEKLQRSVAQFRMY
jgi:methyl-accepting chemotaxis protein